MTSILLIEDDPAIAESTASGLIHAGFSVRSIGDGRRGLSEALSGAYHLVVLDLTLPQLDGYGVLRGLREASAVPVIVITARTGLDPRMRSFQLGADDMLPKPFWVEELVARIHRRLGEATARRRICWGEVEVDLDAHEVRRVGEAVRFTSAEFDLLCYLCTRPNRAITRHQLIDGAFPEESSMLERTIDTHITRVRRKLGPEGEAIETVWRVGYRFVPR